jgi:predicted TPR repeat methyltransferase
LVATVWACCPVQAGNREAVDAYNLGNRQYKNGKYEDAVESYEKCLKLHARISAVYYNLGNAYFQAGDLGRAILAYERAKRLTPRDPDLLQNLHQASLLTRDEIELAPRSGLGAAVELGLSRVSVNELTLAASLVYLLLVVLLLVRLFLEAAVARRALGTAALVLGIALCAGTGALGMKLQHQHADRSAVVLADEVTVRSGPTENFDAVFKLHAGAVVSAVETRGVWDRVEASPKLTGWLRRDTIEGVRQ